MWAPGTPAFIMFELMEHADLFIRHNVVAVLRYQHIMFVASEYFCNHFNADTCLDVSEIVQDTMFRARLNFRPGSITDDDGHRWRLIAKSSDRLIAVIGEFGPDA